MEKLTHHHFILLIFYFMQSWLNEATSKTPPLSTTSSTFNIVCVTFNPLTFFLFVAFASCQFQFHVDLLSVCFVHAQGRSLNMLNISSELFSIKAFLLLILLLTMFNIFLSFSFKQKVPDGELARSLLHQVPAN